jgi:hypothetical protein
MKQTRREFIKTALAAIGAAVLGRVRLPEDDKSLTPLERIKARQPEVIERAKKLRHISSDDLCEIWYTCDADPLHLEGEGWFIDFDGKDIPAGSLDDIPGGVDTGWIEINA